MIDWSDFYHVNNFMFNNKCRAKSMVLVIWSFSVSCVYALVCSLSLSLSFSVARSLCFSVSLSLPSSLFVCCGETNAMGLCISWNITIQAQTKQILLWSIFWNITRQAQTQILLWSMYKHMPPLMLAEQTCTSMVTGVRSVGMQGERKWKCLQIWQYW